MLAALIGSFLFLTSIAPAATYVRVGVGVGYGGGWGYYPYRPWGYGYYPYGPAYYAYSPTVVYTTPVYTAAPVYTPVATTTTQTTTTAPASQPQVQPATTNTTSVPPYGIPESDSQVKSPFSNFIISDTGMKSGTVVYDAYTGQPFRIP